VLLWGWCGMIRGLVGSREGRRSAPACRHPSDARELITGGPARSGCGVRLGFGHRKSHHLPCAGTTAPNEGTGGKASGLVWTTDAATKVESCILAFHDRPGSTEEEVLWPVPNMLLGTGLGLLFCITLGL